MLEPDLGSLVVLMGASLGLIFLAGARLLPFLVLMIVMSALVAALILFEPYRMARLISYMDPWAHAFDSGYQLTQSLIAFGRGEWLGEGLGNSIQKLFYLPEGAYRFCVCCAGRRIWRGGKFNSTAVIYFCCLALVTGRAAL